MGLEWKMVKLYIAAILFSLCVFESMAQVNGQPQNAQGQDAQLQEEVVPEVEVKSIRSYLAPFSYDSDNLRNPFVHPEFAIPLKPGEVYGPFLPLQLFSLNQLKVNGLFWNTSKPKAIITTPDGKTYDVGLKDYIGENFGYIASIREKEVVVIQTLEEEGQRYTTTKVLFLTNNTRSEQ